MGRILCICILSMLTIPVIAQDEEKVVKEDKPSRAAFESTWLIDGQSGFLNKEKTLEFVIQHRFGVIKNGISDLYGLYGASNIRLGLSYAPMNKLNVALGYAKNRQLFDVNVKYGILQQTRSNSKPVSLVYYVNMGTELRDEKNYANSSDRFSYFHELIIARRFNSKISLQLAPNFTHYNAVEGYLDAASELKGKMENDSWGINVSGRYKFSAQTSIIASYDQPLTDNYANDPKPGLSFGAEIATSGHTFQIFFTNYNRLLPQENYRFNQNDFGNGEWLLGFNITRIWGW